MNRKKSLQISKWWNLCVFFAGNLVIILVISMMKFDYSDTSSVFKITLKFDIFVTLGVLAITAILMSVFLILEMINTLKSKSNVEIHPYNTVSAYVDTPFSPLSSYSVPDIVSTVMRAAEKSNVTISKVYLTLTPLPNAYSLVIPFIGSIVHINTNLIDILRPDEFEAAVAHEIGHIKGIDSFLQIIFLSPTRYLQLTFLYLYFMIIVGLINSFFVDQNLQASVLSSVIFLAILAISLITQQVFSLFMRRGQRTAELLADLHAAEVTSPEITINMLIHLGQRMEVINVLLKELKKMEHLHPFSSAKLTPEDKQRLVRHIFNAPYWDIDEKRAKAIAPYIFLTGELRLLQKGYRLPLTDNDIISLAYGAVEKLIADKKIKSEEGEYIKEIADDWREHDTDEDRSLDSNELHSYMKQLKNDPAKFMFKSEAVELLHFRDHPVMRKRILTVYSMMDGKN